MEDRPVAIIRLTTEAARDIRKAMDWAESRRTDLPDVLRDSLRDMFNTLASGALEGAECQLPSGARVRRFYSHPFWIYYQRAPGLLRVLRVMHHAREPLV